MKIINIKDHQKHDFRSMPLPPEWFISEEESKSKTINYKGWIYRQYGKKNGEPPLFIFPI